MANMVLQRTQSSALPLPSLGLTVTGGQLGCRPAFNFINDSRRVDENFRTPFPQTLRPCVFGAGRRHMHEASGAFPYQVRHVRGGGNGRCCSDGVVHVLLHQFATAARAGGRPVQPRV